MLSRDARRLRLSAAKSVSGAWLIGLTPESGAGLYALTKASEILALSPLRSAATRLSIDPAGRLPETIRVQDLDG